MNTRTADSLEQDKVLDLHDVQDGVVFRVYAKPKSSRSGIKGIAQGSLVVRLAAPPVDGKANKELAKVIARKFKVPRTSVQIIAGEHGKQKTIKIMGSNRDEILNILKG
ncbi:MAG: YggU family protein [Deltaproteobacteria bacterium]|nr:YggU family protein [Deltaproteobacteria bacterium]